VPLDKYGLCSKIHFCYLSYIAFAEAPHENMALFQKQIFHKDKNKPLFERKKRPGFEKEPNFRGALLLFFKNRSFSKTQRQTVLSLSFFLSHSLTFSPFSFAEVTCENTALLQKHTF